MRKMKVLSTLILIFCLFVTPLNTPTYAKNYDQPVYYSLDEATGQFQLKASMSAAPNVNITNGYQTFYVDGEENRMRILDCTLNNTETNSIPYTGLQRIKSIANGQTSTTVDDHLSSTAIMTSNSKSTVKNYNFGLDLNLAKQIPVTNILGTEVAGNFLSASFSSKFSFSTSYTTTNTNSEVKTLTKTYTKTYSIPNLPAFENCNSADFYTFTNYYVYDIEAEFVKPNVTSNESLGYVDYTYTYYIPQGYGGWSNPKKCAHCGKVFIQERPFTGYSGGSYDDDNTDMVHVEFANGTTAHFPEDYWSQVLRQKNGMYQKYNPNASTVFTFKYYWPVVEGVVIPYTFGETNELKLNKPIHMVPTGIEQVVYDGSRYYKMIVDESPLVDPYYNLYFPGEQIGDPVLPGSTQTIGLNKSLKTVNKTEKTVVKKKSKSFSLLSKFKNWISISGGYDKSTTSINSSSTTKTKIHTFSETNKYVLPSSFINAGYEGTRIHLTKDSMLYNVTGRILRYNSSTGEFDPSTEGLVTFQQEIQSPRVFAVPFDVR